MRAAVLAAAMLIVAVRASFAAEDCAALDMTQAGLNQCYERAFEASDRELNTVYRQLSDRLKADPDKAKLLVAAQRAWIGFRDADCAFTASSAEGGSAQPMVASQCLDAATRRRVEDLKALLDGEEGDLACPVPRAGR